MGETSADTQREIEFLRDNVSAAIAELERRARHAVDLKAQVEENPGVLGIVGFGAAAGTAALVFNAISSYRESRKPVNRMKRRAGEVREELGERLSRTRERLPLQVTVSNQRKGKDEPVDAQHDAGMLKKIMWAGLTAVTVALFGLLARRTSTMLWERIMGEPPPTAKV